MALPIFTRVDVSCHGTLRVPDWNIMKSMGMYSVMLGWLFLGSCSGLRAVCINTYNREVALWISAGVADLYARSVVLLKDNAQVAAEQSVPNSNAGVFSIRRPRSATTTSASRVLCDTAFCFFEHPERGAEKLGPSR